MNSVLEQPSEGERQTGQIQGRVVACAVGEIQPHPSYKRHQLTVSPSRLSALAECGDFAFDEPLVITKTRTVIDGYCRWELARRQGRTKITCIEYDLTDEEALHWLLHKHRRVEGMNAFCRILLALDLEPWFRKQAHLNQSAGGRSKGSSKLTEADRMDVRAEIAAAAGVCLGNVTKLKQIMATACLELQEALRSGEVSIHKAWQWRDMVPETQRRSLMNYRGDKGVRKIIRRLISNHVPRNQVPTETLRLADLTGRLSQLQSPDLSSVPVAAVDVPGKAVFITQELLQVLPTQKKLPILCRAESR